jgi:hypothetical protein
MEEDILMEEGRRNPIKNSNILENYIQNDDNIDQDNDGVDSDFEEYLQNDFQDELVNEIFEDIKNYINDQAIPLCEYITHDDIEEIVNLFLQ